MTERLTQDEIDEIKGNLDAWEKPLGWDLADLAPEGIWHDWLMRLVAEVEERREQEAINNKLMESFEAEVNKEAEPLTLKKITDALKVLEEDE